MKLNLLPIGVLFVALLPDVTAQPYYRDGDSSGAPQYNALVDGTDANGDLRDVQLWVRDPSTGGAYVQVVDNTTAVVTGVGQLLIDYDYTIGFPPGTDIQFRAIGNDLSGLSSGWVTGSVEVADRDPIASISASYSGGEFEVTFSGTSSDDYDLDFARLQYRYDATGSGSFTFWNVVDLSSAKVVPTAGSVSGQNLVSPGRDVDTLGAVATFAPPAGFGDYQFRITVTDEELGTTALFDRAVSPVLSATFVDQDPIASVSGVYTGGNLEVTVGGDSNGDFDLDHIRLQYRFDASASGSYGSWVRLRFNELTVAPTAGSVSGWNLVGGARNIDTLGALVTLTPPEGFGDYQFRVTVYDEEFGTTALFDRATTPDISVSAALPEVDVRINALAFPVDGYEAWFETSDLKTEVYEVN